MKKSYFIRTLLVALVILGIAAVYVYQYYVGVEKKKEQVEAFALNEERALMQKSLQKALQSKQKALNAIALSLLFDSKIPQRAAKREFPPNYAQELIAAFRKDTLYKNIWLKIFDANGALLYQSHNADNGLNELFDENVSSYLKKRKLLSFIDVGNADLTINSFVPLYDENASVVGGLEVMAHFNSISKQLQEYGIDSVVLVDKSYSQRITTPFTKIFTGGYYVANLDAKQEHLEFLEHSDIEKLLSNRTLLVGRELLYIYPLKNPNKETVGYYVMFKDISHLIQEFEGDALHDFGVVSFFALLLALFVIIIYETYVKTKQKNYYQSIIDNSKNLVIVTDGKELIDANKTFLNYFGFESLEDFVKHNKNCLYDYFVHEEGYIDVEASGEYWFRYLLDNEHRRNKAKLKIGNKEYYFLISVAKVADTKNHYSIVMSDITREEKYRLELERTSVTDSLTGIHNRRYFNEKLQEHILLAERYNRPFSLILMDIDHFKKINDTYGHDRGDKVLQEFAELVRKHIRELDIFCRTGGEEFGLILPETTLNNAVRVAKKINRVVAKESKSVPITVSLGVVEYKKGESSEDIYKRADTALYKAKQGGRNKVVIG